MEFKSPFLILTAILLIACSIEAQSSIDEDMLFSDTNTMVDSSQFIDTSLSSKPESTKVGFSGSINSVAEAGFSRDYFHDFSRKQVSPSAYIIGNFLLDIRLPKDIKAFGNVESYYYSDSSDVSLSLQELFIDANILRKLYIRTGKQVLQWGRCYFWNPTDLINIERKSLAPQLGTREGAYGVKMHVPFGTRYNLYGFIDMKELKSVDSLAGSFRSEALLGTTEVGLELWGKRNKKPVFGIDFSTTIFDFEINGELCIENGNDIMVVNGLGQNESLLDFMMRSLQDSTIAMKSPIGNKAVPKLCIGFSKSFDLLNYKDRVRVISEFYYNRSGVPGDFFKEHKVKKTLEEIDNIKKDTTNALGESLSNKMNTMQNSFVNINDFSRYYVSLFTTVNNFLFTDLMFQLNAIMNIEQKSALLVTSFQYTTIHNLSIGLVLNNTIGSDETEYTLFSKAFSARVNVGISF